MDESSGVTLLESENSLEETVRLKWEMNFKNVSSVRTPVFGPMREDGSKFLFDVWHLREDSGKTSMKVFLRKYSQSAYSNLRFEYIMSVHYSNGNIYDSSESNSLIELSNFSERICLSCISDVYNQRGGLTTHGIKISSDILILKCRMSFFGLVAISPASLYKSIDDLQNLKKFNKDFEALYLSNELSDVSIQVGEKKFMSHKFVLSAHSPVFKTMLMQDFQEAKTGVITISDFEPDVFEGFLKFLYTGEVEDRSISNCKHLYFLADKYNVQILKEECYKLLTDSSLNENEIDEVLEIAYQYSDGPLKKAAKKLRITTTDKE